MTVWYMFIFIYGVAHGHPAAIGDTSPQTFSTLQDCQIAAERLKNEATGLSQRAFTDCMESK